MTDGVAAFLEARLDEEAAAVVEGRPDPGDAQTGEWTAYGHHPGPGDRRQDRDIQMVGTETEETGWMVCEVGQFDRAAMIAAHIARYDPACALRDVEADRRLPRELESAAGNRGGDWTDAEAGYADGLEAGLLLAVKIRAERFDTHPDYRAEWRP